MLSLRERMVEEMILAGLAKSTQQSYLRQVREYFLYLREKKKVSRGAFQQALGGIRFLYYITLENDWSLFSKKRSPFLSKSVCLTLARTRRCERCWRRFFHKPHVPTQFRHETS